LNVKKLYAGAEKKFIGFIFETKVFNKQGEILSLQGDLYD